MTKDHNVSLRTATAPDKTRPPPDPYSALKPHVGRVVPIKYTPIRPGILLGNLADLMVQAHPDPREPFPTNLEPR